MSDPELRRSGLELAVKLRPAHSEFCTIFDMPLACSACGLHVNFRDGDAVLLLIYERI